MPARTYVQSDQALYTSITHPFFFDVIQSFEKIALIRLNHCKCVVIITLINSFTKFHII